MFQKEMIPVLHKLVLGGQHNPDITRKESYRPIFLMNIDTKILANGIQKYILKRRLHHDQMDSFPGILGWFNTQKKISDMQLY